MLPARFLQPWEVLAILQDMKVTFSSGDRYLLVVVDRRTKVLAAFPLSSKKVIEGRRKIPNKALLSFGLSLSIRCDPGVRSLQP